MTIAVKPLEWREPERLTNGCWTADSILGGFSVAFDDGWHACLEEGALWEWEPENDPRSYEGPYAAQAACQAYLDKRVRSALAATSPSSLADANPKIGDTGTTAEGWQDIASAPKDGDPLLVCAVHNDGVPYYWDVVWWNERPEDGEPQFYSSSDDEPALRGGERNMFWRRDCLIAPRAMTSPEALKGGV